MLESKNITKIIEYPYKNIGEVIENILTEYNFPISGNHPDVIMINEAGEERIGIDEVKILRSWAFTKPFSAKHKLVLIKNADMLTDEAQNSLLKITEEPPDFTTIFLLVENHKNLLQTIISRSDLVLRKKVNNQSNPEVINFVAMDCIEKFNYIDLLSKKSTQYILHFLDDLILHLREQNNFSFIKKILGFKENITHNASKKLVLDNLVILLESLK